MSRPVRTRYAPSPTGDPHVGNIRSALFSWALARANGGQFILRIEDTDRARLVETSLRAIIDSLEWLGIDYDEGPEKGGDHGPYFQSQRLELYAHAAAKLIDSGHAYRCFCTAERLTKMREAQARAKRPPGYDGLCRTMPKEESEDRAKGEEFVIRFAMKRTGTTVLEDAVRGTVRFDNSLQNDFVIIKSDGFPTYHLAVIVDDVEMEVTHVVRGDEWISSAPKHVQIYEALGWEEPVWAHLPLILGADGKKLSKRDGDVATLDYKEAGYLPEAMLNFLAFLGWSLDDKTSYITRDQLAESFSLERVVPNPAVFDIDRLDHLNGYYIRKMDDEAWLDVVARRLEDDLPFEVARDLRQSFVAEVAPLLKERVTKLSDLAGLVIFLFGEDAPAYDPGLLAAKVGGDFSEADRVLGAAIAAFEVLPETSWNVDSAEAAIRGLQGVLDLKLRKYIPTLYVAIMGKAQGIPLFDSLEILGRDRTLLRLRMAHQAAKAAAG